MKQRTYRVFLNKEPEGGYTAIIPTLPGCVTYGENMDEAIENVKEAAELYIASLRAHNEPIPPKRIHLNIQFQFLRDKDSLLHV